MHSVYSTIGGRPSQEDRYAFGSNGDIDVFAVFDGHGGSCVSQELKESFVPFFLERFDYSEDSIHSIFSEYASFLQTKHSSNIGKAGSTVVVLVKTPDTFYCANVGDSEAVLVHDDGRFELLTTKHTPTSEVARIESLGQRVLFGRINGMIAISRSFGDLNYDGAVSFEPSIKQLLSKEGHYIILASDGFWDFFDYEEAAAVSRTLFMSGAPSIEVSGQLVSQALQRGSDDNTTVMIVGVKDESKLVQEVVSNGPPPIPRMYPLSHDIDEPMFFLGLNQLVIAKQLFGERAPVLPSWVPQEEISKSLFKEAGVTAIKYVRIHQGDDFVWATEFSNIHEKFSFAERHIDVDGITYASSEHYFQLQKLVGTKNEPLIRNFSMEQDVYKIYNFCRSNKLRSDWEEVKLEIMERGVFEKFSTQEDLKELLLSTGNLPLVQVKPNDGFWSTGRDGDGKNALGVILMSVRDRLRA